MALPQSRRSGISPFYVMEVMRAAEKRAAAGGDVLHLFSYAGATDDMAEAMRHLTGWAP